MTDVEQTGMAVRYSITLVLLALILLYFVGGYLHARQRVRKGLAPLPYHRWMVRRYTPQPHGYQAPGPRGSAPESYDMHVYPPPPPAYNHNEAPPPVYQPPEGASKALADQNFQHGQTHRAAGGEEATSSEAVQAPPATRS